MKIVVLGAFSAGKTQLVRRIRGEAFQAEHTRREGADYITKRWDKDCSERLEIWNVAGEERFKSERPLYLQGAAVAIYCVNLSWPIHKEEIEADMRALKIASPQVTFVIVGTMSDQARAGNIDIVRSLQVEGQTQTQTFITSAKDNEGIISGNGGAEGLLPALKRIAEATQPAFWQITVENLLHHLSNLLQTEPAKYDKMKAAIDRFEQSMGDPFTNKLQAIATLAAECETILNGEYPVIWNSVLTLAAVAVVTLIAALLGFGIGCIAGAWVGPAAFIAGVMAGQAAAVSVIVVSASLGLVGGGLSAYGLFKESKETAVVRTCVNALNGEYGSEVVKISQ